MNVAYLNRGPSTDHGTFGVLFCPEAGFSCYTAEPPWRNNQVRISCIPKGEYVVEIRNSPKYGIVFHLTDVFGRTYILIHSGNFAGDISKGFKTHTMGCILLGQKKGYLGWQMSVLNSRITLRRFMGAMSNETFKLIIS